MEINSSIINHLGKNPRNGGKPPRDKRDKNIKIFIKKIELNFLKDWLMFSKLKLLNIKIIERFKKQ